MKCRYSIGQGNVEQLVGCWYRRFIHIHHQSNKKPAPNYFLQNRVLKFPVKPYQPNDGNDQRKSNIQLKQVKGFFAGKNARRALQDNPVDKMKMVFAINIIQKGKGADNKRNNSNKALQKIDGDGRVLFIHDGTDHLLPLHKHQYQDNDDGWRGMAQETKAKPRAQQDEPAHPLRGKRFVTKKDVYIK